MHHINDKVTDKIKSGVLNSGRTLFIVSDEGFLIGSVSQGDVIKKVIGENIESLTLGEIMNLNPLSVEKGSNIFLVKKMIIQHGVTAIAIVEAGKLLTSISVYDLLSENKNKYISYDEK